MLPKSTLSVNTFLCCLLVCSLIQTDPISHCSFSKQGILWCISPGFVLDVLFISVQVGRFYGAYMEHRIKLIVRWLLCEVVELF